MRRLLVTGGLGFIGSNFIRHMLSAHPGLSIVNLDLQTYAGNPENLAGIPDDGRYRHVRGDVADPAAAEEAMKGAEAVVHFAAESHVDRSILDASVFLRTNVIGTQVMLEQARRLGVKRFLHVSTDEVYGSVPKGLSKEKDPMAPNSPYAASKAASDLMARAYRVTHGMDVIVTRASNNFGPNQFPEKALPLLITNLMDGIPFPLYGDGLNVRDWLYVVDHARALEFLLAKGKSGEIYNVAGGKTLTNKDLIQRVVKIMGASPKLIQKVKDRPGHDRRYALDDGKLRKLGFKHAYKFEDALKATVEWYQNNQSWWRPLKQGKGYKSYYETQYAARS